MKNLLLTYRSLLIVFLFSFVGVAQIQDTEKVLFVKDVKMIQTKNTEYSFTIGYVANTTRDVYLEFSGGPSKFWLSKSVTVNKGRGIIQIKLQGENEPTLGKGYRILLGLRENGGDWKSTKTSIVYNNVEIVNEFVMSNDDAFIPALASNKIPYSSFYDFNVDYNFLQENLIQVSIWDGSKWLFSSPRENAMGKGIKVLRVPLKTAISGTNFKFVLAFGSLQEFDSKQQKTKEITGIEITKEAEKISVEDLDKKSIELTINENTNVLTLLGDPKYESVKIISTKGAIIDQYFNTNKFNTKSLPKGSYFVVTDTGYYFKFNKNN